MNKKISEIKEEFEHAGSNEQLLYLMKVHAPDTRTGVASLIKRYQKKMDALEAEKQRLEKMMAYEKEYEYIGYACGIDEAGRGPLAGPVVAGAVILPQDCRIMYLNDSKQLSEKRREELFDEIMEKALAVGVGMSSPARIDEINILQATYEAM